MLLTLQLLLASRRVFLTSHFVLVRKMSDYVAWVPWVETFVYYI